MRQPSTVSGYRVAMVSNAFPNPAAQNHDSNGTPVALALSACCSSIFVSVTPFLPCVVILSVGWTVPSLFFFCDAGC